ncbi:MAG: hypothetical protein M1819_003479 [Sarea resinae]|nr:MAG: hypothetical protein M1819_003479 [Sarea resinae]
MLTVFTGEVPEVIRAFDRDKSYLQAPTRDGGKLNATWDALLPPGRGFVLIEDHTKFGLSTGLPTGDGDARFSISMFHQLHCLDYVRTTLYNVILNLQSNTREDIFIAEIDQADHLPHCLDYLRQGIMCSGDTSIEGAKYDEHGTVVFGIGSEHKCKDFQAIYDFTAKHADTVF